MLIYSVVLKVMNSLYTHIGTTKSFVLTTNTHYGSDLLLSVAGMLKVGGDADVVVLNAQTLQLQYVIARGKVLKTPEWTYSGMFGKQKLPTASSSSQPVDHCRHDTCNNDDDNDVWVETTCKLTNPESGTRCSS
jgi:electron transfer flavoprotein alpha subunit